MRAIELLAYLRERDIKLWADGDRLRYKAPKDALDLTLRRELAECKSEILEILRHEDAVKNYTSPTLRPISRDGELPLSFAQERLWFLAQLAPDSPAYNIASAKRLMGSLNVSALHQSFNEIVRRHEVFQTICSTVNGKPVQVIAPDLTLPLPVKDLRQLPKAEREAEVLRLAQEAARRPFDLARGPLLRVTLLRLGAREYVLLLTTHHFVADGWSMGILFEELWALYEAFSTGKPSPLPALPFQYADLAHWQREWLQGEVLATQLAYWKKQLADAPAVLELPTDHPRPAIQTDWGATQSFTLPMSLSEAVRALSRREGVTLFMILLAAFQTLLHRYTHQDDIIVAAAVSNRNRLETEGLIGSFWNNLLMRTDFSGNPTFRELLGRVREVALEAYAHQDLPFEKLLEELQPGRDLSRTPLFQVMFTLHQRSQNQDLKPLGLTLSNLPIEMGTAMLDLNLAMEDNKRELSGELKYSADLFDAATITRMLGHFQCLLESIVADPNRCISGLALLTDAQREELIAAFNEDCW